MTNETIPNLYEIATSPKLEKKLHHRYVPMMMYAEGGQEVIIPLVVGTARELSDAEVLAEKDTQKQLGTVPLADRGKGSTWYSTMNTHRSAWILYHCARMPGDLNKKFFENKEQIMDTYDPDELNILMDHYASVRLTQPHYMMFNPDVDTKVAFQQVVDKIRNMAEDSDFFLNSFTTHSVNQLVKYLVSQLPNSETTTGMSGTLSNNTTEIV